MGCVAGGAIIRRGWGISVRAVCTKNLRLLTCEFSLDICGGGR
jgi:hypothetical protein